MQKADTLSVAVTRRFAEAGAGCASVSAAAWTSVPTTGEGNAAGPGFAPCLSLLSPVSRLACPRHSGTGEDIVSFALEIISTQTEL